MNPGAREESLATRFEGKQPSLTPDPQLYLKGFAVGVVAVALLELPDLGNPDSVVFLADRRPPHPPTYH